MKKYKTCAHILLDDLYHVMINRTDEGIIVDVYIDGVDDCLGTIGIADSDIDIPAGGKQ